MNKLSQYLVEQMLLEDENPIKKVVVIYGGRFQPFHKGHYGTYQHLVKKFGKNNVFISTSNKVERPKSPFNFKEKVKIMTTMFNIPKSKIVQVRNNYAPKEILDKYDKETTAFVTVVGEKDSGRLGGKYFRPWKGKAEIGYEEGGYVYASPQQGRGISGTETRNGLSVGSDEQKQNFFKNRAYDKFNMTIFKMITDKLNEGIEIPKEVIEEWLINESSNLGGNAGSDVDDGPSFFFPNYDVYSRVNAERAQKIGWEVIDMITSKNIEDYYDHPDYPNGPVKAVSFFPAGIIGNMTPNNQVDIYSSGAYSQWYKHATRKATLAGYELVKTSAVKDDIKQDKKQSGNLAKGDKKLKDEFENSLNENITLPVKVGDTILTGRFKNKKTVVKSIGKDEHGMPTINGRKVVNFRIIKEGFIAELAGTEVKCEKCNHSWEIESEDTEKYLCHSCGWDSQKQEYDYDAFDSWREKMGLNEELDERGGKLTPAQKLRRKAALAGKKSQIARRRVRTMKRRKDISKLKKIAYKQAYRQVYDEFKEKLFPDTPNSELSRIDTQLIHKNVLRKKKRILKRARLVFLPKLRDAENQKFGGKSNISFNKTEETNEMSKSTLNKIEKYAEKQLSPEDIEFTKHFFDRLNDPRNEKEISDAELTGFFKRLSKYKRQFKDFLEKYKQIVVTDKRYDINIPFVKQANQIIAKTVMRKKNFQTSNPKLTFEGLNESTLKLRIPSDILKIQKGFKKNGKKLYVVGGAVRDAILGKSPKDFDLATDAKPDEVLKIAKDLGMKTVEVGKSFGVVMVGGHEIATFRKDIGKGRRPSSVDYTDIEGDVRRRDLTINALFYDIDRKEIVDLVGGIADLKKKNIRTVGKASERFDEDPLRKLRALRFQARLGGNLDKELLDALQKDPSLKGVSFERVRDEVIKSIKSAKDTKKYMELNDKIGFTSLIFPNLNISKPYINDNDYILFLASVFKKNSPSVLGKQLNKLTYSNDEKNNIVFLVSLQHFKPEEVVVFKKLQEKTSLSDDQILKFGKLIGKDMKKFVNFNLSVGGKDVPSDIKGPEIGLWIKNKEKEKFMNEIEQLISDIDDKLVEMFLPNTKTPQQLIKENINESKLLMEGGAYGHMSHPFDTDINLTFGQLKDIVNRALEGTLEYTREKTDGQALAISWRDGRLVAARNKGHLKNKGENALDIKGVSDKFQGRGGLSDAYNYAMKDLSNAIKSLNDKQRDKIFKQGACFMNLEVIYPTSVNVIPYGQALLVFHGTMEYNDEGVAIGENGEAARILAGMIKQVNKDVQDNYTIQGPPVVKLPKSQDLSKKRSKYSSQISKLQKEFGLKDTDGVANYHQAWWEQWVDKNSPSTLDNKTKMGLVKRWAFMDKGFRLDKSNISDEKTLEWAKKTDKDDQKKIGKQNLMKFEQIFLGLGAEVLEFTSSALTVNPDSAVRDMKKRIDKTIKDVKKSGDPKKIEKLKLELGRLNSIGGAKKIVPNEGIVFLYNGKTFKLTGTFASVNQILGIFF